MRQSRNLERVSGIVRENAYLFLFSGHGEPVVAKVPEELLFHGDPREGTEAGRLERDAVLRARSLLHGRNTHHTHRIQAHLKSLLLIGKAVDYTKICDDVISLDLWNETKKKIPVDDVPAFYLSPKVPIKNL